jgi:iron complex outermembrane recepter protein
MLTSRQLQVLSVGLLLVCLAARADVSLAEVVLADADLQAGQAYPITISDNLSEDDYLGDLPKVLTVSRLSQSIADAPSAVTVIDRATIRATGAVDIPELFRLVPGMYVGTNAGYVYNTNHAVSYHGMNTAYPGNMQVLINGRSVYTPLFGGVKWSELPIAMMDIERIEITRGPNAASYGANAFAATVNILTSTPSETPANTVLATHGNGRNEAFYRYAGKAGDLAIGKMMAWMTVMILNAHDLPVRKRIIS